MDIVDFNSNSGLGLAQPFSLRLQIAGQLLSEIFRDNIPAGSRLVIQKLAKQHGVSSTPVREAIMYLESVGVVRFEHNRGAIAKAFGPGELREIYQIRRVLEVEATRIACGRIDHEAMQDLRKELIGLQNASVRDAKWSEIAMIADRNLHQMIVRSCGSNRLADEIRRYDTLTQVIRHIIGNRKDAQFPALQEHLAILDALLSHDLCVAMGEMAKHIDHAAKVAVEALFGDGHMANHAS